MQEIFDLIVVGGGPTGINVGVEAHKAELNYLIIEKGVLSNSIYRFPANMTFFSTSKKLEIADIPFISHSDKPTRREALEYYRRIVESYDLNINYYEEVLRISKDKEFFIINTVKDTYRAINVVITTGYYDQPRLLNVPGENLSKVKHYYDEAHPYVGQKILVVGAANSACDVALETWQQGASVTMAIRGDTLYQKVKYWILPNIENRIKEGSISAYFNTEVEEIKPTSVILKTPEGRVEIENDFVLAMTGYTPDYKLLDRLLVPVSDSEEKAPVFDPETLETTVSGLYVAGVIISGLKTSKVFIENSRHHGDVIINHIMSKKEHTV